MTTYDNRLADEAGAAINYLRRPFSLAEVVARTRAILAHGYLGAASPSKPFADVVIDDDTRQLRRGDAANNLTTAELRLLRYLLRNPRRVLSRTEIADNL